jgi:hypothetical protein
MTTYTPIARLPIMQPGDAAVKDNWGAIVNAAWPCVEQLAAGNGTIDLTGKTTYTLLTANDAADQARQAMLAFVGTPLATCTVTIPSVARIGWVSNKTTFPVVLSAGGTTKLTIPAGASFLYTCDGANVSAVSFSVPAQLSAAGGVVINNGSAYSALDSTGTSRALLAIDAANNTNLTMGGSAGWRVLNQAGTTALMTILPSGAATFAGGLTVTGPLSASGTLAVGGATTLAGLTVTGAANFTGASTVAGLTVNGATSFTSTTSHAGTASFAGGMTATGFDAGGFNTRYVGGVYGSGWRNDGANTYLLVTAASAPLGIYNGLRPFYFNNATGAVTIDGTAAGTTFGGTINVGNRVNAFDMVLSAGNVYLANGAGIQTKDAGGSYRLYLNTGTDNWTNQYQTGNIGWRVLNQSGTVQLFSVDTAGNANCAGALGVAGGGSFGGNVGMLGIFVTNGGTVGGITIGGSAITIPASATVGANLNVGGTVFANGNASVQSGNGAYTNTAGHQFGPWSVGCGVVCANALAANGLFATSDRRLKTDIADITDDAAYDWITRGRPRTYQMAGRLGAGFVAQEEVDNGRGAAVAIIPDDRPEFAVSDGYAPAGARMARRYEHDIAYLTKALQGALARIAVLEAR